LDNCTLWDGLMCLYKDMVGRATGWKTDDFQQGQETFTSSKHPDQLYGPHSLLLNTYRGGGGGGFPFG
jgi:hypothetical protein